MTARKPHAPRWEDRICDWEPCAKPFRVDASIAQQAARTLCSAECYDAKRRWRQRERMRALRAPVAVAKAKKLGPEYFARREAEIRAAAPPGFAPWVGVESLEPWEGRPGR